MTRRRIHRSTSLCALVVLISIAGLFAFFLLEGRAPSPAPSTEIVSADDWLSLHFTDPISPAAAAFRGGPDSALVKAIDEAQYTVDVAVYRLDLWSVRNALIRAHNRNVVVRVIIESNHALDPEIADLEAAGIQVVGDRRGHLMHHKFVVIDRMDVWTGSMNLTLNGVFRNHNNLIRIRSNRVSQNFAREFDEMFEEDRFGALSLADTPFPFVIVNGVLIETYFSPDDDIADRIMDLLSEAQVSIHFLAFAFTSDEFADAMIERAQAGVIVRGVFETVQAHLTGAEYERLFEAGVGVRLDGIDGLMHHKVIVIDGEIVITGSYNFSRSAEERNDENIIILHDEEIAEQFLVEFESIFLTATP